jgi:glycosyltransferase involved in cell wall biosynthesis
MKLLLVDNIHIYKTEDGYYTPSIYGEYFFNRYLKVFSKVRVIAKTRKATISEVKNFIKIDLETLEIFELPWYQGSKGLIMKMPKLIVKYFQASKGCDRYIFRMSQIESIMTYVFRKRKKYFSVELVNDPETFIDVNPVIRKLIVGITKRMISKANGVSYVTEQILQKKYSVYNHKKNTSDKYFECSYSSIELSTKDIAEPKKNFGVNPLKLIHVANSINSDIKGHSTVIKVIQQLKTKGISVSCYFIGDGNYIPILKKLVEELSLEKEITFCGNISDRKILLDKLKSSDIFIYPTKMEGLPRALIEAMASGLPCLSSPTVGIPELIEKKYLFDPLDVSGFSNKIIQLTRNIEELESMSIKNCKVSTKFTNIKLNIKRTEFYTKLHNLV